MLGLSADEQTYATRYKQGGRTVFSLSLSPAQLVGLVPRPDPKIPNPGNRAIKESHARSFADYYLTHKDWVIPGIILRAGDIFKFESDMEASDGFGQWGILSFSKRAASSIQILDGQHRTLGFHIAQGVIKQRIEKARDFRARAIRQENGDKHAPLVKEAEGQLRDARLLEDRFSKEHIIVEVHVTDDAQEYRQMFFDIADNAMSISASTKTRFDTRKVVNRATAMLDGHPLLENRVERDKDRLAQNSDYFLSLKHVADIVRATLVGLDARVGKAMERDLDDRFVADSAKRFFDDLMTSFPQLYSMSVGQVTPMTVRETSVLGSPGMIRALAAVWHDLQSEKHGWAREDVVKYFKALEPHMAGPAHAKSIWYEHVLIKKNDQHGNPLPVVHAFREGAFSPGARRQDVQAVSDSIREWAILGKRGAPWVWKKPAPIPAPPKTEDELLLEEQIAADPELGELLARGIGG